MTTSNPHDLAPLVRATALAALDLGLSVLPPKEDGSKAPLPDWGDEFGRPTWKPAQEQPTERERVERWYADGRTGVGLVCGAVSGGLECFEFDDRPTYDTFWEVGIEIGLGDLLERIEAGYVEDTPGGGVHWFYYCEEVRGSTRLAQRPAPTADNPRGVKTLIETKGEGGFVIIAPSGGRVHPTGGQYRLIAGELSRIVTLTTEERDAFWNLARSFDEMPQPKPTPQPAAQHHQHNRHNGDVRPGDEFNRTARWEDILDGWRFLGCRGETQYLRRPGKEHGVSAAIRNGRLNVYSTSTAFESVLENRRTYDKLGALALLHFNGDLAAAVRALAGQGYGTPPDPNFGNSVNSVNSRARVGQAYEPQGGPNFGNSVNSVNSCARVGQAYEPHETQANPNFDNFDNSVNSRAHAGAGAPARDDRIDRIVKIPPYTPPSPSDTSLEWSDPILDEIAKPEPFPLDTFPDPVADLAHQGAACLCCPVDYLAVAVLGIASGSIGRSVALRIKEGWTESAALYVALVGDPGTTKSPAVDLASRPIGSIAASLMDKHRLDCERFRMAGEKGPGPRPQRISVDDTTVEALAPILRDNPRGVVMIRDELSALFAGHNQYKNGRGSDRQFYLQAWSGSTVTVDRKNNPDGIPIHIPHPFLSIVGGLTPEMLSELSEAQGRDDGFLDRMLFTAPDRVRVRWQPGGIPEATSEEWEQIVGRLWNQPMARHEDRRRPFLVWLSEEAQRLWAAWFDAHCEETEADDFPAYLIGPWAKYRAYCARLALVLDRLARASIPEPPDNNGLIAAASMASAIRLVSYFKSHTRRVRALMRGVLGENPDARTILQWLKLNDRLEFSIRDLRRHFPKRFPVAGSELENALRWLQSRHCIRPGAIPDRQGAGRPPSPIYEVNPTLFKVKP